MDLSFASRASIGRLARPLGAVAPGRSVTGLLDGARMRLAGVSRRRAARIALICALIAIPLAAGGWLWLRSSPFVAVQKVEVSGVHGPQARAIEGALADAAKRMSTLHVDGGALRAAVAQFRVVSDIRVKPIFPHGLRLIVTEQLPVAALLVGGTRTAVSADGTVLGPALLSADLPTVGGAVQPLPGEHLKDFWLRASMALLGAAPAALEHKVERVYLSSRGLTVAMRNGLLAYFGDASRPHAKWMSLARVLAAPSSAGASYVDVRLPGRPAAGFPAGVVPPGAAGKAVEEGSEAGSTKNTESTVDSLAAGLGAGTSTSSTPVGAEEEESGSSSEPSSSGEAEASSEEPSGGTSASSEEAASGGAEAEP